MCETKHPTRLFHSIFGSLCLPPLHEHHGVRVVGGCRLLTPPAHARRLGRGERRAWGGRGGEESTDASSRGRPHATPPHHRQPVFCSSLAFSFHQAVPELAHLLGAAPSKPSPPTAHYTTLTPAPPRRPTTDDTTDAEALDDELARVKKEHASLLASLASARSGAANTGAALQAADDARLRAEVAAKRASLDAAREERAALEAAAEKARLATVDAEAGRGPPSPAARRVAELRAALATAEAALDGDATRQRLYTLLEERTM